MKVINHIHRQNVISNKVNSIHMAANSQTYLCITVTGIRRTLIRAEKSVERKMTPVTQKWFLNNDRYAFFFKIDFTFSYFMLRKFALNLKIFANV